MEQPCKNLSDDPDMDSEPEDIPASCHQPRASVLANLLPLAMAERPEHIYVRNQAGVAKGTTGAHHRVASMLNDRTSGYSNRANGSPKQSPKGVSRGNMTRRCEAGLTDLLLGAKENFRRITNADLMRVMGGGLKDCTFSPTISQSRSPRSFNQFLHDQSRRQKERECELEELQMERQRAEAASLQQSPTINPVSSHTIWIDLEAAGGKESWEGRRADLQSSQCID